MAEGQEVGVIDGAQESENGGGTALATRRDSELERRAEVGGLLRPVESPADVLAAQEAIRDLVETALVEGRDYMTIPGTNKPTLVKPGAERIQMAFGAFSDFEIVEKEIDHDREIHYSKEKWEEAEKPDDEVIERMKAAGTGRFRKSGNQWVWQVKHSEPGVSYGLYRYVIRCRLISRASGVQIGSGIGVASTMESKYIDRPRDLENTIAKMAKKRAQIDAVLSTFGLSEMFTQDLDDMSGGPTGTPAPSSSGNGGAGGGDTSAPSGGPAFLDSPVTDTIGSPKKEVRDLTWREAIQKQKGYVQWVVENYRNISDEQRNTLKAALDPQRNSGPGSAYDQQQEPRIQKEQIKELRNLGKELGVSEDVERFIEKNPGMEQAAHQIAKAKVELERRREQQAEAEEHPDHDSSTGNGADEPEDQEEGSLFDEDDDLPF